MDTKSLLSRSMWNSGILSFMFATNTLSAFGSGSVILGVVGVLATYFTVRDTVNLYKATR